MPPEPRSSLLETLGIWVRSLRLCWCLSSVRRCRRLPPLVARRSLYNPIQVLRQHLVEQTKLLIEEGVPDRTEAGPEGALDMLVRTSGAGAI